MRCEAGDGIDLIEQNLSGLVQKEVNTGKAATVQCPINSLCQFLDFQGFLRGNPGRNMDRRRFEGVLFGIVKKAAGEFDLVFSVTEISSTAELLYHILMSCPEICGDASRLPVKAAEALLAGMTTDTNNFSNSVFPSTFRMASELLGAGIDRDAIVASLYNNYRENRFRLMGELLHKVMKITPEGAAYMIISKDLAKKYDLREGETEGFVNMALGIKNVRMSLLLKEEDDRFRVSVRSKRGISANRCAALYFNGGGHELASGGKLLKEKDLDGGGPEKAASYTERVTGKFLNDIQ